MVLFLSKEVKFFLFQQTVKLSLLILSKKMLNNCMREKYAHNSREEELLQPSLTIYLSIARDLLLKAESELTLTLNTSITISSQILRLFDFFFVFIFKVTFIIYRVFKKNVRMVF